MSLTNAVPADSNSHCKRQLGLNQGEIEASLPKVNRKCGAVAGLPHLPAAYEAPLVITVTARRFWVQHCSASQSAAGRSLP
jgi:hypothetical protein